MVRGIDFIGHVRPEVGSVEGRAAWQSGKDLAHQDPDNWHNFVLALRTRLAPDILLSRTSQMAGLGLFGDALSVAGVFFARRLGLGPLATLLLPVVLDEGGSAAVTAAFYRGACNSENYTVELFEGMIARGFLQGVLCHGGRTTSARGRGFLRLWGAMMAGGLISRWGSHHLFGQTENPLAHRTKWGWALEAFDTGMMLGICRARSRLVDIEGLGRTWVANHVEPFGGFRGGVFVFGGGRRQSAPQGDRPRDLHITTPAGAVPPVLPQPVLDRYKKILRLSDGKMEARQNELVQLDALVRHNKIQQRDSVRGLWNLLVHGSAESVQQMLDRCNQNLVDPLLTAFAHLWDAGVSRKKLRRLVRYIIRVKGLSERERNATATGFIYQVLMTDTLMEDGLRIRRCESTLKLPASMHTVREAEEGSYSIIQDPHPPNFTREDALTEDGVSIEIKTAFRHPVELTPVHTIPEEERERFAKKNRTLLREVLRMRDMEATKQRTGSMLVIVGPQGIAPETVAILLGIHPTLEIRHYVAPKPETYLSYRIDPTVDGRRILERRVHRRTGFRRVLWIFDPHPLVDNRFYLDLDWELKARERRLYNTLTLFIGSPPEPADTPKRLLEDVVSPLYWMGERLATIRRLSAWEGLSPFRKDDVTEAEQAMGALEELSVQTIPPNMSKLDLLRRMEPQISPMAEVWRHLLKTELHGLRQLVRWLQGKDTMADRILGDLDQSLSKLEEDTFGGDEWTPEDLTLLSQVEGIFEANQSALHLAARAVDLQVLDTPNPVPRPLENLRLSDFDGQAINWLVGLSARGKRKRWANLFEHTHSLTELATRSTPEQREGMVNTLRREIEMLQQRGGRLRAGGVHLLENLGSIEGEFQQHTVGVPKSLQHVFHWLARISRYVMEQGDEAGNGG